MDTTQYEIVRCEECRVREGKPCRDEYEHVTWPHAQRMLDCEAIHRARFEAAMSSKRG